MQRRRRPWSSSRRRAPTPPRWDFGADPTPGRWFPPQTRRARRSGSRSGPSRPRASPGTQAMCWWRARPSRAKPWPGACRGTMALLQRRQLFLFGLRQATAGVTGAPSRPFAGRSLGRSAPCSLRPEMTATWRSGPGSERVRRQVPQFLSEACAQICCDWPTPAFSSSSTTPLPALRSRSRARRPTVPRYPGLPWQRGPP
mmetsp:Transcript_3865/g.16026  ORF Transcript_3865/g.16026 Transcript_3865/m.16026 type:complete len:200 (+) Transcript_3865:464-1063(+)